MITVALRQRPIHAIFGQCGHTRTNCQQIRAGGENFPQMFPGNTNISKWLKQQRWGNFFSWRTFRMKQWLWCLCTEQQFWVYEPQKRTKRSLNTIKLVCRLQDAICLILCPELNLPHRVTLEAVAVELLVTWITGVWGKKKLKGIIIKKKLPVPVQSLAYGWSIYLDLSRT